MGSFCGAPPPPAPDGTIDRWLLCDECVDGELDAVLILGSDAVPTLVNTLDGPPPDRVENVRDQLTTQYARVVASIAPASPTLTTCAATGCSPFLLFPDIIKFLVLLALVVSGSYGKTLFTRRLRRGIRSMAKALTSYFRGATSINVAKAAASLYRTSCQPIFML